jgi:hypothetical protein
MTIVRSTANLPWTMEVDAGTYKEGMLVKEGTAANRLALVSAKGDTVIGIINDSRVDPKTAAHDASVAGDKRNWIPLGTKQIVHVYAAAIGQTYAAGVPIYADDAVDGGATPTAATSRPIGHYPRNYESTVTTVVGGKVACYLDVEPGASLV